MADEPEEPRREPTTYMSKDGYALPIKAHKYEASGLRPHAKAYIRRNQKISRLAKELLPPKHPDADVPLRSRARHLRPTRRHDDFSTTHKPVRWYEQKSFSRSQKYATREVRRRALSETHPVPLMGVHTPFHGARYAPGPVPTGVIAPPLKLAEKLKVMGNWPLPDTPRCAEMHLAELALQEDIAQRKRDEASRLEKLKEEKARADAEFREMRRAAAKAAGLPSPPATPSVRSLDSSDGFDSVSDSGRSSLDSPRSRPSSPIKSDALSQEVAKRGSPKKRRRRKKTAPLSKPLVPPPHEPIQI